MKKIKVPLMLDSTYDHIIELGLKYSQGKAIINSINLEDGESKFEKILPLIHQYGAKSCHDPHRRTRTSGVPRSEDGSGGAVL